MHIQLHTNTTKSQFRQVKDGVWQILGIPITVDNAVMNGILYEAEENAKGLHTYRNKPVTLRHPEDENGNGVSALSADGLMKHFAGGVIINTYNSNGINYADAEFKEKMMLAQDNGEYYLNLLKNGEDIGISTGLYFSDNREQGMSANGREYYAKAVDQQGDHIAMLPEGEDPAGGSDTFIRFNGGDTDKTIHVNIDDEINNIGANITEIIDNLAENDKEKGLLSRFFAMCRAKFATTEESSDNITELTTNKEDHAMRDTLIAMLQAKGVTVNAEISDAELLAKYNEVNTPDLAGAINSAIEPLTKEIETLKAGITANADKELEALATQAAPLLGVETDEAKSMGVNALHKVLAKNGVVIGAPTATNHETPKANSADEIDMKPWEAK